MTVSHKVSDHHLHDEQQWQIAMTSHWLHQFLLVAFAMYIFQENNCTRIQFQSKRKTRSWHWLALKTCCMLPHHEHWTCIKKWYLYKILECHASPLIVLGNRDNQSQIGIHHLVLTEMAIPDACLKRVLFHTSCTSPFHHCWLMAYLLLQTAPHFLQL